MRSAWIAVVVVGLGLGPGVLGCGSSSASAAPPAPCPAGTPVALTVKNYLSWCSVSVEGLAASSAASQAVCVADGSISLSATALVGFKLGPAPWHGTSGDTGSGDPGTVTGTGQSASSAATVTASGTAACAWICCPFTDGTGCPTTDLCAASSGTY